MNLDNFEEYIEPKIVNRGAEYFNNGFVDDLREVKKNNWIAEVSGTENYEVVVRLGAKAVIKDWECDCPYDYGTVCKHVVAVLYGIRNLNSIDISADKPVKKTPPKKITLDSLLKKIEVEEFRAFIKHYASIQKGFRNEFELYFSDKDELINLKEKYAVLIRNLIKKHTSRGYINYSNSNKLGRELKRYLKEAQLYLAKKNLRDAFTLVAVLISEVSLVFQDADDSNGYLEDVVDTAIEILEELAVSKTAIEFKEQLAAFCREELQKLHYFDFDFAYDMTALYAKLCIAIYKINDFIVFIDEIIKNKAIDKYQKRFFIEQKIVFLKEIGQEKETKQLIEENLSIPEIRMIEINRSIKEKDFKNAKKLLAEGIKIAEKNGHPGTVRQWETKLLEIAQIENDKAIIRHFLYKFTFDRGINVHYYKQWKATFKAEEWQEVIENEIQKIIQKINNEISGNRFGSNRYYINSNILYYLAPIYIQENKIDRLWELVQAQNEISTFLKYLPYLKNKYAEELLKKLLPTLEDAGKFASGRSDYRALTKTMKIIVEEMPESKDNILEIIQRLKDKFPRRPAMIDEFDKFLKTKND